MIAPRGVAFVMAISAITSLIILLGARAVQAGFKVIGWQIDPSYSYVVSAVIFAVLAFVWHFGTKEDDKDE